MIGTAVTPTTIVISPPAMAEFQAAPDRLPKVNLHHVAYYRDDTGYDDLLRALQQRVSVMQKHLAVLTDR
jgi:hypothetical protein